jgi:protein gp37
MANSSKIEWTEATWNPVRGCTKISPGCKHCYAETFAERFRGVPGHPYEQGFDLRLVPEKLTEPFSWASPRTVFVNSMSDLFQEGVSDDYIIAVARVMMAANWHTYQILTKRSERMRDLLNNELGFASRASHIWWGVSVEDREYGIPRMNDLRQTAAEVRFVSIEPLLEDLGDIDLSGIHWAIVGGESGPGARPMNPSWVESIFLQCRKQDVPFFFKQWGGTQKRRTGRQLHNRTYDEVPRVFSNDDILSRNSRIMLVEQFEVLASSFRTEEVYSSQRKGKTSATKKSSRRRAGVRLPLRNARATRA